MKEHLGIQRILIQLKLHQGSELQKQGETEFYVSCANLPKNLTLLLARLHIGEPENFGGQSWKFGLTDLTLPQPSLTVY